MKNEEKEMIDGYEIRSSMSMDGKRMVFGINETDPNRDRYFSAVVTENGLFGSYEGITTGDYFEAVKHFADNIKAEAIIIESDQRAAGCRYVDCLGADDLIPCSYGDSIKNLVVAVKPDCLPDAGRFLSRQLYYVDSGFGVEANSRGRACYGWDLYRRKRVRINRPQVLGIVPEDKLPDFAKKTLADIQSGVLKEEYDVIKKKDKGER